MKRNQYWYPIDNAGKIFPAVSKDSRSSVFRLSFYLKEKVKKDFLEQAVNNVLPRFETFAVELKSGLFWYYLSANDRPFQVEEESARIAKFFSWQKNNGYLFKVYYYENKITLETFHSLTDGTGAMEFLKSIVYKYFELQGHSLEHDGRIRSQLPHDVTGEIDMFVDSYDSTNRKSLTEEPAYHLSGEKFKYHFSLAVRAQVPTERLSAVAKANHVTIGQYVTAAMAYSIYSCSHDCRTSKKPIKIFIPVNLRKFFPSNTLRNFSLYIKSTFSGKESWTFEKMLASTKEQFADQLTKEDLHRRINSNVSIEKNPFIRILPLAIKNLAFQIGYYYCAENISTYYISNLGNISLPTDLDPYIDDVEFALGGTCMAIASIHGHTNLMLNSEFKDITTIQYFLKLLTDAGIPVTIDTNYKEGYDEIL
ncbi:hypothetical protein [Anaerosporobacter faecicola]|uniref:hypothetical protein n=1 Tax=Anaerosporobacter faecicola TaxID=2718714 RepID=UPI00143C8E83|nr:hypothetical protein [Anaerosporobacter faecicola]